VLISSYNPSSPSLHQTNNTSTESTNKLLHTQQPHTNPIQTTTTANMKTFTTVAALNTLFLTTSAQYFGLISSRSASPIHYQTVSASNQSLWLNKPTASYCPPNIKDIGGCPSGNTTDFAGGDNTLGMGAVVPGGQQVYIDSETGAVKYTIAHSAAIPEGDIQTGWNLTEGESFGYLSNEHGGFIACPAENDSWQVYVALECLEFDDACLGFSAIASNSTQASAWQYT
jgi:hypothetical protein